MPKTAEVFATAIVAIGDFNPAIVTPDWLERHQLIGPADCQFAREQPNFLISREIALFSTDWFELQVTQQKLQLGSKGPVTPAIKDLAVSTLLLLPQTPIRALGINFMAHFKLNSMQEYHKVGDVFAPKSIWKEVFPGETTAAGLETLVIRIDPFKRGETPPTKDAKRLTLQPSAKFQSGVFLSINDHIDLDERKSVAYTNAELASQELTAKWDKIRVEAQAVFVQLIERALAQEPMESNAEQ